MHIELYQDRNSGWRWRAVDTNNRIVCDSAESYVSMSNLERAVDNVVNGFRGHLEVKYRNRRTKPRAEGEAQATETGEVLTIVEYQAQGEELPHGKG